MDPRDEDLKGEVYRKSSRVAEIFQHKVREMKELKSQLKQTQRLNKDLTFSVNQKKMEIEKLQESNQQMKKRLLKDSTLYSRIYEQMQAKTLDHSQDIQDLQLKLSKIRVEKCQLESKLDLLQHSYSYQKEENRDLTECLNERSVELKTSQSEKKKLKIDSIEIQNQNQKLQEQVKTMTSRLHEYENESADVHGALKDEIHRLEMEMEQLNGQNSLLEMKIQVQSTELSQHQDRIHQLEGINATQEEILTTFRSNEANLNLKNQIQYQKLVLCEWKRIQATGQVDLANERIQQAAQEIAILKINLQRTRVVRQLQSQTICYEPKAVIINHWKLFHELLSRTPRFEHGKPAINHWKLLHELLSRTKRYEDTPINWEKKYYSFLSAVSKRRTAENVFQAWKDTHLRHIITQLTKGIAAHRSHVSRKENKYESKPNGIV